ncbi:MAG: ABC transporter permease [Candidatus Thermoplasmatota archaeon]|nr:ABC transporter permease [Candidatus Thermoplasmatota archaeon]MEC8577543.1 ABC transporter permease [Candidatus Thermoplasmatota archaeon]MED6318575.1 ABC transporter permease [Candidatus Thermoplasmatota archaeon]
MVDGLALSQAIQTTFLTSGTATLFATLIGVPLGAWCARQHHRAFRRLKTLITALYGLPPVVVGVFVYSLFSKSGALGSLDLLFTVEAMIFAQTCLILPLVWGGSWTAFEGVGKTSSDTLATLGINERQRLFLEIRLASNGVYHAVVIAFGRAIAEVGAVIMVGGNIAGKTRVMTTSIVLETSKGNMEQAGVLGLLLLALSLALVGLAAMVQTRRKRSTEPILGEALPQPTAFEREENKTITVQKSGRTVLHEVVLGLKPGTIIAVVGESGAGKTTLLRALAGLEGDDVKCGPKSCIYVQQEPVLLTASVASEMMLPHRLFPNLPPSGQAYAQLLQLDDKVQQNVIDLSGGERQRLVLARQLSFSPSLLLLDECTSNLGWLHVQTIEKELMRLRDGGTCIVMVTHNIPQAQRMADKIVVLHDGKVLNDDDPFAASLLKGQWLQP